jgi:hypothetical protein
MRHTVLGLALSVLLVFTILGGTASAAQWVVAPGENIQAAINGAAPGDEVLLLPGVHTESVILKNGVVLRGSGRDATTLRGTYGQVWYGNYVVSGATGATLADMTVDAINHTFGLNCLNCVTDVTSCRFIGANEAIRIWYPGTATPMTITNNIFTNVSDGITCLSAQALISNNLFYNITRAIGARDAMTRIVNNTLVGLGAEVGATYGTSVHGILLNGGTSYIANNIVTRWHSRFGYGGVCVYPGITSYTLENNDVWDNGPDYVNLAPGTSDISADPLFLDLANADFRLAQGSPCIEAGTLFAYPPAPSFDLEGDPRLLGAVPDIGADETDYVPPQSSVSLSGTRGENGFWTAPVVAALSAEDPAGVGVGDMLYSLDGAFWQSYQTALVLAAEGSNTLFFHAVDLKGNEEHPQSLSFSIDTVAPMASSLNPPHGAKDVPLTTPVTVTFTEAVVEGAAYGAIAVTYQTKDKMGKALTVEVPVVASLSGNTLTVSPLTAWEKKTLFTVSLPAAAVKDLAGLGTTVSLVYSFDSVKK